MMEHNAYLAWKRKLVIAALHQRGFDEPPVEAIRSVPAQTRRRAMLKCRKAGHQLLLGFYEADSHRLVDIAECPVLAQEITALLAPLKQTLGRILNSGEQAELHATASDTGLDLSLKLARRRDPDLLMELSRLAAELDLARLSFNGEPIAVNTPPALRVGGIDIALPPEAFLQPSKQGEELLQHLVSEAAGGATRVADLFCGCGTFAFLLAGRAQVAAIDSATAQVTAVNAAARKFGVHVEGQTRDLFRRPLIPAELERFDCVVLDPPRPGTTAQARNLAQSGVPSVLYVSCNPASFARDARILCDGGYRLIRVVPVDQFLWSPHVELFAQFTC
jgi:23S rRNA (uracil1939-C5)-methyltransferase